ncbi:MAG: Tudor-knot domain-containing protein [Gallionellaceae bacterium]
MKKIFCGLLSIFCFLLLSSGAAYAHCKPGAQGKVLWKGKWYPATAVKSKGNSCYIHYDGYAKSWDEWVESDRRKFPRHAHHSVGDPIQVKWKNTWYPAHVIGVKGSKLKVHYDSYESSWDEWVGPSRYKKR